MWRCLCVYTTHCLSLRALAFFRSLANGMRISCVKLHKCLWFSFETSVECSAGVYAFVLTQYECRFCLFRSLSVLALGTRCLCFDFATPIAAAQRIVSAMVLFFCYRSITNNHKNSGNGCCALFDVYQQHARNIRVIYVLRTDSNP